MVRDQDLVVDDDRMHGGAPNGSVAVGLPLGVGVQRRQCDLPSGAIVRDRVQHESINVELAFAPAIRGLPFAHRKLIRRHCH